MRSRIATFSLLLLLGLLASTLTANLLVPTERGAPATVEQRLDAPKPCTHADAAAAERFAPNVDAGPAVKKAVVYALHTTPARRARTRVSQPGTGLAPPKV